MHSSNETFNINITPPLTSNRNNSYINNILVLQDLIKQEFNMPMIHNMHRYFLGTKDNDTDPCYTAIVVTTLCVI